MEDDMFRLIVWREDREGMPYRPDVYTGDATEIVSALDAVLTTIVKGKTVVPIKLLTVAIADDVEVTSVWQELQTSLF